MERQRGGDHEQYAVEQVLVLPESLAGIMTPDELAEANQRYVQMHAAIEPLCKRAPRWVLEQGAPIPYQMAEILARRSYMGATPEELAREIYGSEDREFVSRIRSRLNRLQYALFDVGSQLTIDVLPETDEQNNNIHDRWYVRYRHEESISRINYLYQKGPTLLHLIRQEEYITGIDSSDSLESDSDLKTGIFEPYSYQAECLERLNTARGEGKKRGLVVMATGTGKTAVAAFDALQAIEGVEEPRVLYVCHQADILTRAQETFGEVLGEKYTYGYYDGKRKSDIESTNVLFATFQTLGRNLNKFTADHFDYIVVDESHHAHAETYRPIVDHFQPGFKLGITATPDRSDLHDIRELFGEEVYSLPLERALAQGLLSKIDYRVMSANIDSARVARLKQLTERDVTIALLDRELFQPMAIEEVVEKIQEKIKEVTNPHVMIFTPDVEECEKVAGMMEGAVAIHSKMNGERGAIVKSLQRGEVDTAVAVDVFNEGIDIPRTNVLVFLRSTSSKTIFYQQLGRGLRKFDGKDSVLVLDFVGNVERIRMIQELAEGVKREGGELRRGDPVMMGRNVDDIGDLNFEEIPVDVLDLLGVAIRNQERWTEEQLIADLRHIAERLGKSPRQEDVKRFAKLGECAGATTYVSRFGSFNNALLAAGLSIKTRRYDDISDQQFIANLQALAKELGRVPTTRDIRKLSSEGKFPSDSTLKSRFGSFNKALQAAGLDMNRKRYDERDDSELLSELRAIAEKLGRAPTSIEIDRLSSEMQTAPSSAYQSRFGTYSAALRAAGLNSRQKAESRPNSELIADLIAISTELGRTPTSLDIDRLSKEGRCQTSSTYFRRFGSFNEALRAAGMEVIFKRNVRTDNELLENLKAISEELGRAPIGSDIERLSKEGRYASLNVYTYRFGSYNNALIAAGLSVNRRREERTNAELIEDLIEISQELGKTPTMEDIHRLWASGRCASRVIYTKRFGTFNGALKAAGLTPNIEVKKSKQDDW